MSLTLFDLTEENVRLMQDLFDVEPGMPPGPPRDPAWKICAWRRSEKPMLHDTDRMIQGAIRASMAEVPERWKDEG